MDSSIKNSVSEDCCSPTPMSFEKELEYSMQRTITHLAKVQQVRVFIEKNKSLFKEMQSLGIKFYID